MDGGGWGAATKLETAVVEGGAIAGRRPEAIAVGAGMGAAGPLETGTAGRDVYAANKPGPGAVAGSVHAAREPETGAAEDCADAAGKPEVKSIGAGVSAAGKPEAKSIGARVSAAGKPGGKAVGVCAGTAGPPDTGTAGCVVDVARDPETGAVEGCASAADEPAEVVGACEGAARECRQVVLDAGAVTPGGLMACRRWHHEIQGRSGREDIVSRLRTHNSQPPTTCAVKNVFEFYITFSCSIRVVITVVQLICFCLVSWRVKRQAGVYEHETIMCQKYIIEHTPVRTTSYKIGMISLSRQQIYQRGHRVLLFTVDSMSESKMSELK